MEGTVKERLMKFYNYKSISKRKFEQMCGFSNGYMNKLRSKPSDSFLEIIYQKFPELNKFWLLTGEGEMINESSKTQIDPDKQKKSSDVIKKLIDQYDERFEFVTENKNQAQFFRDETGELRISVPHVPYAARAEFANYSDRLEKESEGWSREMYQVDKIVHGTYFSFDVKGESMDDGSRESLQDGDKVLVRELERDFWKDIRTGDHRYWVIVFGSSVLIKEIVSEDTTDGTIVCHSLNPSPEYSDFTLNLDEVRYLFYVIKIKPKERTA